ncbi:MAG: hypothetical protein Q9220_004483 [cf. Caloplaca sp. 1 TL-2023]
MLKGHTIAGCVIRVPCRARVQNYAHSRSLPFLLPTLHTYSTKTSVAPIVKSYETPINPRSRSKVRLLEPSQALNPPSSTLPPPLSLPAREPNLSGTQTLKFYYLTGRGYLSFYKEGIKAIYQNFKLVRQLRTQIPKGKSSEQALRDGLLSRAEYHVIDRTRKDVSRIPVFGLVLLICGEFTPLVVIFLGLSGAVPRICHIPRQIQGAREKLEARRRESFREGTVMTVEGPRDLGDVQHLPKRIISHLGKSLGLYSSLWDRLGILPTMLLPRRVENTIERIDVDDLAISRGGGVQLLNEEELKLAAEARGLDITGKSVVDLQSQLASWMLARKRTSIIDLLSRRPSAWPSS